MLSLEALKGVKECTGLSRREFLRVGALTAGAAGLSLADLVRLQGAESPGRDVCSASGKRSAGSLEISRSDAATTARGSTDSK